MTSRWSPCSDWRIALQVGTGQLVLTDPAGHRLGQVTETGGTALNSPHAWSPDGRLLAVSTIDEQREVTGIRFLAMAAGQQPPAPMPYPAQHVLGWTDGHHLLTGDINKVSGSTDVALHDLTSGTRQVLTSVGSGGSVGDLASRMLPHLTVVPTGTPDYGPRPLWLRTAGVLAITVPIAVVASATITLMSRRRQRSRRPRPR